MRARTLATACPVSVSWIKIASTILKSSKTYLPESVTKYVIFPQNCHHLAHIELTILDTDSKSAHFCRTVCRVQNVMKGGGHRERNRKEFFSKLLPHPPITSIKASAWSWRSLPHRPVSPPENPRQWSRGCQCSPRCGKEDPRGRWTTTGASNTKYHFYDKKTSKIKPMQWCARYTCKIVTIVLYKIAHTWNCEISLTEMSELTEQTEQTWTDWTDWIAQSFWITDHNSTPLDSPPSHKETRMFPVGR